MKALGFYCIGHDANMCAWDSETDRWAVIELERLYDVRHFHLDVRDRDLFKSVALKCVKVLEVEFGIEGPFDLLCLPRPQFGEPNYPLEDVIQWRDKEYVGHQMAHGAAAFYQSSFSEALVACIHGGGDDGFFNVYLAGPDGLREVYRSNLNLGMYSRVAKHIHALRATRQPLSFPGKAMGLAAYGKVRAEWMSPVKGTYLSCDASGLPNELPQACDMVGSADLSATNQAVFEELLIGELTPLMARYPGLPLCLSGGCALNVTANELLLRTFGREMFVPPNSNDAGLAAGYVLAHAQPKRRPSLAFAGLPLLGRTEFQRSAEQRGGVSAGPEDVAAALAQGEIVGVCHGASECGPRALGNRSILCDPSQAEMKERLNARVKHREWFRPFAGCVRAEDVDRYFHSSALACYSFMSFSPKIRSEWSDGLGALAHPDGTCRIQTVHQTSEPFLHAVLTEFHRLTGVGVLLNTSLNTHGRPLVSTVEAAKDMLQNHNLDALYLDGFLIGGGRKC